jgi:hypothetical protein
VLVHRGHPLGQELALGAVLVRVLALHLEDEARPVRQNHQEIGAILPHAALEEVVHLEAE